MHKSKMNNKNINVTVKMNNVAKIVIKKNVNARNNNKNNQNNNQNNNQKNQNYHLNKFNPIKLKMKVINYLNKENMKKLLQNMKKHLISFKILLV